MPTDATLSEAEMRWLRDNHSDRRVLVDAPGPWCVLCARDWPCPTARLLDTVEAQARALKLSGATLLPDGSVRMDMRKFNAAHRCEEHGRDYKTAPEWDRCTQCIADERDNMVKHFEDAALAAVAERDALRAERDQFKAAWHAHVDSLCDMEKRYDALRAENAKLRCQPMCACNCGECASAEEAKRLRAVVEAVREPVIENTIFRRCIVCRTAWRAGDTKQTHQFDCALAALAAHRTEEGK